MRFRIDVSPSLPAMLVLAVFLTACGEMPTAPEGAGFDLPVGFAPAPQPDVPGVLDFGSVGDDAGGGAVAVPAPYQEEGFSLVSPDVPDGPSAFSAWPEGSPNYAGSAALWLTVPGTTVEMTLDGGGAFDVLSIDLSEQFRPPTLPPGVPSPPPVPFTVTLTGELAGGGTVTQDLPVDGVFGFQTFALVGFEDIVKLSWQQGSGAVPGHQFDNIDFVIPEAGGDPVAKDECKDGGWEAFGFKNQGQCVRFVNTGKDSR